MGWAGNALIASQTCTLRVTTVWSAHNKYTTNKIMGSQGWPKPCPQFALSKNYCRSECQISSIYHSCSGLISNCRSLIKRFELVQLQHSRPVGKLCAFLLVEVQTSLRSFEPHFNVSQLLVNAWWSTILYFAFFNSRN